MSQPADATARQQLNLINSPVFKAISCIPLVGHVSAIFAHGVLKGNFIAKAYMGDISRNIECLRIDREYRKIDTARNLLSAALVVGAVALGILSPPAGIILANVCLVFAMISVYRVRKITN